MSDAVVFIPLSKGKVTAVDFDDFEAVRRFKWSAADCGDKQEHWFAYRGIYASGKSRIVYLHHAIMGVKGIDHINGDPLDNRRSNLRRATKAENLRGFRLKPIGATSKYRGVSFWKRGGRWKAQINRPSTVGNGIGIYLGYFSTEEAAARAYDSAAMSYGFPVEALNFQ